MPCFLSLQDILVVSLLTNSFLFHLQRQCCSLQTSCLSSEFPVTLFLWLNRSQLKPTPNQNLKPGLCDLAPTNLSAHLLPCPTSHAHLCSVPPILSGLKNFACHCKDLRTCQPPELHEPIPYDKFFNLYVSFLLVLLLWITLINTNTFYTLDTIQGTVDSEVEQDTQNSPSSQS